MSKPTIAVPTVTDDEVKHLSELRQSVRRVHKSVPAQSQVRRTSADPSQRLQQLPGRGVPLHTWPDIVGPSPRAVRTRVRGAPKGGASRSGATGVFAHTLTQ